MSTVTLHKCDICGGDATELKKQIQVVFITEQTEGRPTSPHLSNETLDLCKVCLDRLVRSHPLRGSGAQGFNTFEWTR